MVGVSCRLAANGGLAKVTCCHVAVVASRLAVAIFCPAVKVCRVVVTVFRARVVVFRARVDKCRGGILLPHPGNLLPYFGKLLPYPGNRLPPVGNPQRYIGNLVLPFAVRFTVYKQTPPFDSSVIDSAGGTGVLPQPTVNRLSDYPSSLATRWLYNHSCPAHELRPDLYFFVSVK